jgi:hypothetical protein
MSSVPTLVASAELRVVLSDESAESAELHPARSPIKIATTTTIESRLVIVLISFGIVNLG